jgi:hypothetical protein
MSASFENRVNELIVLAGQHVSRSQGGPARPARRRPARPGGQP